MDRVPHTVPVTDAAPVEPFQRVEVITGIARRRRWSEQDKARIVAESLEPGVVVADIARRYGLHRNQLYDWRAAFGIRPDKIEPDKTGDGCPAPAFVPVTVASEAPVAESAHSRIEIVLGAVSVRLTGHIDATALRQVMDVIRSLA